MFSYNLRCVIVSVALPLELKPFVGSIHENNDADSLWWDCSGLYIGIRVFIVCALVIHHTAVFTLGGRYALGVS